MANVALKFDGVGDSVEIPHASYLNPGSAFTVEAWVRADDMDTLRIVGKGTGYTDQGGWDLLVFNNAAKLRLNFVRHNVRNVNMDTNVEWKVGEWFHIAVATTDTSSKYYINGTLVGTDTFTSSPVQATDYEAYIGRERAFWGFCDATIRDVRIWSTERTGTEISTNMNTDLTGSETGLVGLWKLDEGYGMTAYDSVTNVFGRDGSLRTSPNTPTWVDRDVAWRVGSYGGGTNMEWEDSSSSWTTAISFASPTLSNSQPLYPRIGSTFNGSTYYAKQCFFSFDTGNIGSAKVASAYFKVYAYNDSTQGDITHEFWEVGHTASEASFSSGDCQRLDTIESSGHPKIATMPISGGNGWFTSTMVSGWENHLNTTGFTSVLVTSDLDKSTSNPPAGQHRYNAFQTKYFAAGGLFFAVDIVPHHIGVVTASGVGTATRNAIDVGADVVAVIAGDTLTISGSGPTYDYDLNNSPFNTDAIATINVEEGVTVLGTHLCSEIWNSTGNMTVNIADSVTEIKERAFQYCAQFVVFNDTSNLTTIGIRAFSESGLFNIKTGTSDHTLPPKLETIGDYALDSYINHADNPYTITTLNLPASLLSMGHEVFRWSDFTSLHLPQNVNIVTGSLHQLYDIQSYTVDASNPYIQSIDGVVFSKSGATLVQYPVGQTDRVDYVVPDGTQIINDEAFRYAQSPTGSLITNEGLLQMGEFCLSDSSATILWLSSTITTFSNYAISGDFLSDIYNNSQTNQTVGTISSGIGDLAAYKRAVCYPANTNFITAIEAQGYTVYSYIEGASSGGGVGSSTCSATRITPQSAASSGVSAATASAIQIQSGQSAFSGLSISQGAAFLLQYGDAVSSGVSLSSCTSILMLNGEFSISGLATAETTGLNYTVVGASSTGSGLSLGESLVIAIGQATASGVSNGQSNTYALTTAQASYTGLGTSTTEAHRVLFDMPYATGAGGLASNVLVLAFGDAQTTGYGLTEADGYSLIFVSPNYSGVSIVVSSGESFIPAPVLTAVQLNETHSLSWTEVG